MPTVSKLEAQFTGLLYYELPTLNKQDFLYLFFLNEGMRTGISNTKARQRTITLYLDKTAFHRAQEMPEEQHIYILLLDQQGNKFFAPAAHTNLSTKWHFTKCLANYLIHRIKRAGYANPARFSKEEKRKTCTPTLS